MSFGELKKKIVEITNNPVFEFEGGAHGEWTTQNNVRYCNVFALVHGNVAVTIAICQPNQDAQEALKEAVKRLSA